MYLVSPVLPCGAFFSLVLLVSCTFDECFHVLIAVPASLWLCTIPCASNRRTLIQLASALGDSLDSAQPIWSPVR